MVENKQTLKILIYYGLARKYTYFSFGLIFQDRLYTFFLKHQGFWIIRNNFNFGFWEHPRLKCKQPLLVCIGLYLFRDFNMDTIALFTLQSLFLLSTFYLRKTDGNQLNDKKESEKIDGGM